jgi:hypothetical protein
VLNRYTTLIAGRKARNVFRNEARVIELAESLSERSQHPQLMPWVAWLVIMADGKITDDETLLFRHLVRLVRDRHQVVDEQLAHVVDLDPSEVWRRLDAESGDDLSDILDAANRVAMVDGPVNTLERAIISQVQDRCGQAGRRHAPPHDVTGTLGSVQPTFPDPEVSDPRPDPAKSRTRTRPGLGAKLSSLRRTRTSRQAT